MSTAAPFLAAVSSRPLYDGTPDVSESLTAVREAGFDATGLFLVAQERSGTVIVDCRARCREQP